MVRVQLILGFWQNPRALSTTSSCLLSVVEKSPEYTFFQPSSLSMWLLLDRWSQDWNSETQLNQISESKCVPGWWNIAQIPSIYPSPSCFFLIRSQHQSAIGLLLLKLMTVFPRQPDWAFKREKLHDSSYLQRPSTVYKRILTLNYRGPAKSSDFISHLPRPLFTVFQPHWSLFLLNMSGSFPLLTFT